MADAASSSPIEGTPNDSHREERLADPQQATVEPQARRRACLFCGNSAFRRSHLRLADTLPLLLLLYPVRCMRCGQRQRALLPTALAARPPRRRMRF